MLRRSVAVTLLVLSAIGATVVPTPKSQCEDLLNVVLPQAEKLLASHAEFFPFGASMKPDGQIAVVAAYEGRERPPSQSLIDLLHDGFHRDAVAGSIIASATVYDVRVVPPGDATKTDAIEIELDHRDNYSYASGEGVLTGVSAYGPVISSIGSEVSAAIAIDWSSLSSKPNRLSPSRRASIA
jgi:hypothetical protein